MQCYDIEFGSQYNAYKEISSCQLLGFPGVVQIFVIRIQQSSKLPSSSRLTALVFTVGRHYGCNYGELSNADDSITMPEALALTWVVSGYS